MVEHQLAARGIRDVATLAAMGRVPRELFVPRELRDRAYEDGALAIGHGQTISQPFIVARMTEALQLARWAREHSGEPMRVLDVGTGSGYQAAVLAEMGADVTSVEWDAELSRQAGEQLAALGYRVRLVIGDGGAGYADGAPYAGITVGAASPAAPQPLVDQLADGGSLVVPIGPRWHQDLMVIVKHGDRLETRALEPCVFVPLLGSHGYH
jgi:protein-L-isoaspartate(D-aspartate) O-methyltransferase